MMDDINPVMKEVLKAEQYNDTIFLGSHSEQFQLRMI